MDYAEPLVAARKHLLRLEDCLLEKRYEDALMLALQAQNEVNNLVATINGLRTIPKKARY